MAFTIAAVDQDAEENGTWAEYRGGKFLIARNSNIRFQRAINRLQQPHFKKIMKGKLDPQVAREATCEAMAEGILMGWKEVVDESGKAVKFTKETAKQYLLADTDFREFVAEFSDDSANYRNDYVEELVGKPE